MNRKFDCVKTPNRLITDTTLHYSARQLGCTLYGIQRAGVVTRSLSRLARISGIGSVATVQKGLQELLDAGYIIAKEQHFRYCEQLGRDIYDSFSYRLDMSFTSGYTLIPKSLLRHCRGQYSLFAVAAYICVEMGNEERSFPSLKRIARRLGGMSISTVCRAIKALVTSSVLHVRHCIKRNRANASNSYFLLKSLSDRITRSNRSSILLVASPSHRTPVYNYLSICRNKQHLKPRRGTTKISKQRPQT